jgi:hypothetical protein
MLAKLREQLSRDEWQMGSVITAVATLCGVVRELVAGGSSHQAAGQSPTSAAACREKIRRENVERLRYYACKAVPKGVDGEQRDIAACSLMLKWRVRIDDLLALGYDPAIVEAAAKA